PLLKKEASLFFKDIEIKKKPVDAISQAYNSGEDVVVTGSLYLVGEAEKILDSFEGKGEITSDIYSSNGKELPVE
ncbi:MAG: hypothetical protein QW062_01310, partial [Thermoplasmatales archaeon]